MGTTSRKPLLPRSVVGQALVRQAGWTRADRDRWVVRHHFCRDVYQGALSLWYHESGIPTKRSGWQARGAIALRQLLMVLIPLPRMSAPADERAKYEPRREHTNAEPATNPNMSHVRTSRGNLRQGRVTARITVTRTPSRPEPGEADPGPSQPRGGITALSECAVDRTPGNTEALRDRRASQRCP